MTVFSSRFRRGWISSILLAPLLALAFNERVQAQGSNVVVDNSANHVVGGVSIDAKGILENAQLDALGQLAKMRTEAIGKTPDGLQPLNSLRKISLRKLEAKILECAKKHLPLPEEIKYLGGLQCIQYVFVYPEQNDIVLAGPGEGWKVDVRGNVVGITTGRPVMQLDDLLVALRSARDAAQGGIRCSIDPTAEGVARLKQVMVGMDQSAGPKAIKKLQEEAMGMQQITLAGVPNSSHFAQVLVAADYRMKRIGMNFEPAPKSVKLPSYLQMLPTTSNESASPRWWMEPKFEAILKDSTELAWEFRGSSVQTMTEDDFYNASGERGHSGKAGPLAKSWADMMTKQYPALAVADPIFGELQNCMEMAIVSALVVKERLPEKAGNDFPVLFADATVKTDQYNVPKQIASQASLLKKSGGWIVSVSGGVVINSWSIADKVQTSDSISAVREKAAAKNDDWCWN